MGLRFQEDVLGFQVAMDQLRFFDDFQGVEDLGYNQPRYVQRQSLEEVLLQEIVY